MNQYLAVDSNALTYLLDSVDYGYDPCTDPSSIRSERVAMLRCFFYGGCSFWVPPTAQVEYQQTTSAAKREAHDRWTKFLLQDMPLEMPAEQLQQRARELLVYHGKQNDCNVVAETEASGLATLLSCDGDLISRLQSQTFLRILRPTAFWKSLSIPASAQPVVVPTVNNPLTSATLWYLSSGFDQDERENT